MKKIFTLLFSVGVFATSFAQTGSRQVTKKNNPYVTNAEYKKIDSHHDNIYTFSASEKDMRIAEIARDYRFKIAAVKNNNHISRRYKKELIQKAQSEKEQEVQALALKFKSKFNTAYNAKQYNGYRY